jgi:hypothetical protein
LRRRNRRSNGVLWRNVAFEDPSNSNDKPVANDPTTGQPVAFRTADYALRLPFSGSDADQPAREGIALREALAFQAPLVGRLASNGGGNQGERYSVARVRDQGAGPNPAILAVAKLGSRGRQNDQDQQLILRVYNPTEEARALTIELRSGNDGPAKQKPEVRQVSALEKPITKPDVAKIGLGVGPGMITFTAIRSLTTLCEGSQCPK